MLARELVGRFGWIPRRGIVVGKLRRVAGRLRIKRTVIRIVAIAVVIIVARLVGLVCAEIVAVRTRGAGSRLRVVGCVVPVGGLTVGLLTLVAGVPAP